MITPRISRTCIEISYFFIHSKCNSTMLYDRDIAKLKLNCAWKVQKVGKRGREM